MKASLRDRIRWWLQARRRHSPRCLIHGYRWPSLRVPVTIPLMREVTRLEKRVCVRCGQSEYFPVVHP